MDVGEVLLYLGSRMMNEDTQSEYVLFKFLYKEHILYQTEFSMKCMDML